MLHDETERTKVVEGLGARLGEDEPHSAEVAAFDGDVSERSVIKRQAIICGTSMCDSS